MRYGSFNNMLADNAKDSPPEIGTGVTEIMWTDRNPYEVVEVISKPGQFPSEFVIRSMTPVPDIYMPGTEQHMPTGYAKEIKSDPDGRLRTLTLRADGKWRQKGDSIRGTVYKVGLADYYRDPCF